jgi:hypothetical protein
LLSLPPLLVLVLAQLWLPQVQSCAELIQLLLSVASASVLTPSAFLFAGGAVASSWSGAGLCRCWATSSFSHSITAPKTRGNEKLRQMIQETSHCEEGGADGHGRTVGDEVDADGELASEDLHLGLLGLETPCALL